MQNLTRARVYVEGKVSCWTLYTRSNKCRIHPLIATVVCIFGHHLFHPMDWSVIEGCVVYLKKVDFIFVVSHE